MGEDIGIGEAKTMNNISVSGWTVTGIDAVVHVIGALDPKPLMIDGHPAKRFKNRAYHGLVLRLGGRVRYAVKGHAPIDTLPGTLLYLSEGCDYDVISYEEGDCVCVNFHIAPAAPVAPFMIALRRPADWEKRFADMARLWTCRPVAYAAHLNARLYEALAGIDEELSARYLPQRYACVMRDCVSRLENDLARDWTVARLAAECGMSETYFRRLFREVYGLPPRQYLIEARLRRARALLENTDAPVSDVGESAGFESHYHFSRAFRAREGVSPSEYRRRARQGG